MHLVNVLAHRNFNTFWHKKQDGGATGRKDNVDVTLNSGHFYTVHTIKIWQIELT